MKMLVKNSLNAFYHRYYIRNLKGQKDDNLIVTTNMTERRIYLQFVYEYTYIRM